MKKHHGELEIYEWLLEISQSCRYFETQSNNNSIVMEFKIQKLFWFFFLASTYLSNSLQSCIINSIRSSNESFSFFVYFFIRFVKLNNSYGDVGIEPHFVERETDEDNVVRERSGWEENWNSEFVYEESGFGGDCRGDAFSGEVGFGGGDVLPAEGF
ncbi:hypothetical protein L6452_19547 [Arctium lappa]|uniref:Uncharacterized protein n=1 Tax=Arctium lappa TaxID=4217 RepID=A0ACB9BAP7_ARCLA|nr:hypothetical protein L6452_19547 [Arctium lappa]